MDSWFRCVLTDKTRSKHLSSALLLSDMWGLAHGCHSRPEKLVSHTRHTLCSAERKALLLLSFADLKDLHARDWHACCNNTRWHYYPLCRLEMTLPKQLSFSHSSLLYIKPTQHAISIIKPSAHIYCHCKLISEHPDSMISRISEPQIMKTNP